MSRRPSDLDRKLHDSVSKTLPESPDEETPADRPTAEMLPRPHVAAADAILGRPFKVLDDGFVRVLDYMGDDSAIVQAARISYGAGTKKVHEDRGLIRYLMRHRHCYDDKTEVLTDQGFVRWPDVKDGMRLGIWDPDRETLCYEHPSYFTAHRYRGKMYRVDHGGVDLSVTPDHKMYVRTKKWDPVRRAMVWSDRRLIPASELGHRSTVRYTTLAPFSGPRWRAEGFPGYAKSRSLLELVGFFVGDGSTRGTRANGIDFHLKNPREIQFLRRCSADTGWELREFPSYEGRRRFVVYANSIGHLFRRLFYQDDQKVLPDWALALDRDEAGALLAGFRASDGTEKRGAWELSTTYPRLAEQVQRVALHAGEAAQVTVRNTGMRGVMFLSHMTEPVVNQTFRQTSWEDYDGFVYCAATRTGVLVVRRNGKIVLSGNTTPFEMCDIKFHVRTPMDAWRQWIRHRTACLAAGTRVVFDLPTGLRRGGWHAYAVKIEDLYRRFQPTANKNPWAPKGNAYFAADRIRNMKLRQMNEETGLIQHTPIVNVYANGVKTVFRMVLDDGKTIECTADHRFKFAEGWATLNEAVGLHLADGCAVWKSGLYDIFVNGVILARAAGTQRSVVVAKLSRIKHFEYVGQKPTYDVEVEGPFHNFIANGIVTHNSVNEYSTRYSVAIDATQQTPPDQWRAQSAANRQGSSGALPVEIGEKLSAAERALQDEARRVYDERLAAGVAREQARKDLPLSTYTEAYWKINLHNLLHFLDLRMDDHAQEEIRAYARVIGEEIVAKWVPIVWEAFLDYRRRAMHLSSIEAELIRLINLNDRAGAIATAERHGLLARRKDGGLARNRERTELEAKLAALGIAVPWA